MSRITRIYATTQTLSIAAMEEASRFGVHDADIEHLFLALLLSEQTAGQVLRRTGITLEAARTAVADQHGAQIASLGIEAELPSENRITFHEDGQYEWTDRAIEVFTRAGRRKDARGASAVLRELLDEPSGIIAEILTRLGTSPERIAAQLEEADQIPDHLDVPRRGRIERTEIAFVPAMPEAVWVLLTTPERLPEWDAIIGRVDPDGDVWQAWTRTVRPDGTTIAVKPQHMRQHAHLTANSTEQRVTWRFHYPDDPHSNTRRISISLEPAASGTQLSVTVSWERTARPTGLRRLITPVMRWILAPVVRWALWMQHQSTSAGISRALRE
ncbi:Clp protease N-terminal domain-containing protein [Microbacterium suaedae]|uniref:Clp protease N-terminal domain-containing protein n=1 Tax=Microbacterium suaedae TaxID=2067813 RepID=UPI000DA25F00|nr:Clp protease N-terminal domain-containing protein [Microbacterium suaedae]